MTADGHVRPALGPNPLPMADAHHHLWDLSRFRYAWLEGAGEQGVTDYLGEYGAIRRDYLIDELLREYATAGIVRSVHVQADISEDPVAETAWLEDIAERHGFPNAIVTYADLRADDAPAQLDRHLAYARVRGVRMPDEEGLLTDPRLGRAVAAMEERAISLEADTPHERMPELSALADRFPRMSFALGHVGMPEERSPEYFATWRDAVREVAKRDNIVVKISGLGMRDPGWTIDSIRPYVFEAIEAFGVGRCMFGTNWPVDRLYGDLTTLANAYRSLIADLEGQQQRDLLLHNAERFYRMSG